jgi:hypothetical protein
MPYRSARPSSVVPLVVRCRRGAFTQPSRAPEVQAELARGLGREVGGSVKEIRSVANENDRFSAWIDLSPGPKGARVPRYDEQVCVDVDGAWWPGTVGTTRGGSFTQITLDRPAALELGRRAETPLVERARLDEGLRFTWRTPAEVSLGAAAPFSLDVTNDGAVALVLDHHITAFAVEATRDGVPLPSALGIHTGPSARATLAPGSVVRVEHDLRDWVRLDAAGRYVVRTSFRSLLRREAAHAGAEDRDPGWDVRAEGGPFVVFVG